MMALFATTMSIVTTAVAVGATHAAAAGQAKVAQGHVHGLIQSTGNLYWTSLTVDGSEVAASIYRASKSNIPGNEYLLYREYRSDSFSYDDITYAYTGTWYGYFVVNYFDLGISQIKRVPLSGGNAVTLVTSPSMIGPRDIDTDGSFLYWADAGGLRKMPLAGGVITTLAAGTNITSIGLDAVHVFYSAGPSVRSVDKAGGNSTSLVTGSANVTSIQVYRASGGTEVYSSWQDGLLRSDTLPAGGVHVATIYQAASTQQAISVPGFAFNGSRLVWVNCYYTETGCYNLYSQQGRTKQLLAYTSGRMRNLQSDTTAVFWNDEYSLWKYLF
jgi:hypothetical protein